MYSIFSKFTRQTSDTNSITNIKKEIIDEKQVIQKEFQILMLAQKEEFDFKMKELQSQLTGLFFFMVNTNKYLEKENEFNKLQAEWSNRTSLLGQIEQTIQSIIEDDLKKDQEIQFLKQQLIEKTMQAEILTKQLVPQNLKVLKFIVCSLISLRMRQSLVTVKILKN